MNCLVFFPDERLENVVRISGRRAQYVAEHQSFAVGQKIRVAEWQGLLGSGVVKSFSPSETIVEVSLTSPAPQRRWCAAIVAVPRPQALKRVLFNAAMLGFSELHLIKSAGVEKSYLQSKSLEDSAIQRELVKGLEQAIDSLPPIVSKHRSWDGFCREALPDLFSRVGKGSLALLADTSSSTELSQLKLDRGSPTVITIGPESGWSSEENAAFVAAGFIPLSLGQRILRVDAALLYLHAQLAMC